MIQKQTISKAQEIAFLRREINLEKENTFILGFLSAGTIMGSQIAGTGKWYDFVPTAVGIAIGAVTAMRAHGWGVKRAELKAAQRS